MAKYYIGIKTGDGLRGIYSLIEEITGCYHKLNFYERETSDDLEDIAIKTAKSLWEDRNPLEGYDDMDMLVTNFGTLIFYGKRKYSHPKPMELSRLSQLGEEERKTFESSLRSQLLEYMDKAPETIRRIANQ